MEAQKLIEVYTKAQQALIDTIATKEAKGNVTWYQKSLLSQVTAILKDLDKQAEAWVKETLPEKYQAGISDVNKWLNDRGIPTVDASFAQLHTDAINVLMEETLDELHGANSFVRESISGSLQQSIRDAVMQKIATGQTVLECKKNLVKKLSEDGITGILSKNGRTMSLNAYASVVARSKTREATNTATLNQLTSLGYDLVKMSSHNTSCPICAVMQGRVYSISGNDTRYPPLSVAFSGAYANVHPNCSHVLIPYIPELADDPEGDRELSRRSFDLDPRSQKQVDIYNMVQKQKKILRDNRRLWEKMRLVLPDETPGSFQGFMRVKKTAGERWDSLHQAYKEFLQKEKNGDIIGDKDKLLPGHEKAVIDDAKFLKYSLNPLKDKNKAEAFLKALGFNQDNYIILKDAIKNNISSAAAKYKGSNQYGKRYEVIMDITGPNGKTAKVLTGWMVDDEGTRMVTVHVDD